ncbi:MAG: hypothetical protein QOE90_1826 [Thermoplasmata archaeon]|jgi:hypothetical protein|nr:hypothetical protein [Thermoplasmata archaeon]
MEARSEKMGKIEPSPPMAVIRKTILPENDPKPKKKAGKR